MFSFKRKIGNQAEAIALKHLLGHGLTLVEKNYLIFSGEIDIIMLDKLSQILVFVEVRYRFNATFGSAIATVDRKKQAKIIKAAQYYLQQNPQYQDWICRFDVIGIESELKYPEINWVKDAF